MTDTPKNEDSLEEEESSESDNELGPDGDGGEDNDEVASVEETMEAKLSMHAPINFLWRIRSKNKSILFLTNQFKLHLLYSNVIKKLHILCAYGHIVYVRYMSFH